MSCRNISMVCPMEKSRSSFSSIARNRSSKSKSRIRCELKFSSVGMVPAAVATDVASPSRRTSEEKVYDVVLKQAALVKQQKTDRSMHEKIVLQQRTGNISWDLLNKAYDRCGEICAEFAKTFYLGTLLMTPERKRAIWSIYAWCRRTDELVDGPIASHLTPRALDRWEERLTGLFEGHPYDMYDAALSDTVSKFPVDIQPFKHMIQGMRMDLNKSRARRGRIYLPQDELAEAGLSDDDIFRGKVTESWRNFIRGQIKRARMLFDEAEKGIAELNSASRWPVWASLLIYRQILDAIEANDYDNFRKRAFVGRAKKLFFLSVAYGKAVSAKGCSCNFSRLHANMNSNNT